MIHQILQTHNRQGLICGRTSAFLLDPNGADVAMRKRVTVFQSHEVAHMWYAFVTSSFPSLSLLVEGSGISLPWNGGTIFI